MLYERDGVYTIRVDGLELMSSRAHGSEDALARLAMAEVRAARPNVLVGGLGMGFTLRAVLDVLPAAGGVVVAEILPEVVRWNQGPLAELAGSPLEDPRVELIEGDVARVIGARPTAFDAILLDVDNGPAALTLTDNDRLYQRDGLELTRRSLRPKGMLAVWSAGPDPAFERALRTAGFLVRVETVRARSIGKGPRHTLFFARLR